MPDEISDVSADDGGVATETPPEEKKEEEVVIPPSETPSDNKTFIHNNQTYNLTPEQQTYLISEGFNRLAAKEQDVETTTPAEVKPAEKETVEAKIKSLEDKLQKQEQTSAFDKNNVQIENEFTKLFQNEDFSERGTQLVRELTFSVMGRQGVGTTQAFNLSKEVIKGFKDEVASSKEVRSKIVQDYVTGKIEASELTLGETSPGKASGMTDDKPLTMGGLVRGEAGRRLRAKLSKV